MQTHTVNQFCNERNEFKDTHMKHRCRVYLFTSLSFVRSVTSLTQCSCLGLASECILSANPAPYLTYPTFDLI